MLSLIFTSHILYFRTCIASFQLPHAHSRLTVGARALAKHCHRDQMAGFWGPYSGSDSMKNELAISKLYQLLGDIAWINIHSLPHDLPVLELRNSQGYGARWSADGTVRMHAFI